MIPRSQRIWTVVWRRSTGAPKSGLRSRHITCRAGGSRFRRCIVTGPLPSAATVTMLARRFVAALGWAHFNGVVHGRICPRHIVIDPAVHHILVVGWGGAALEPARSGQRVLAPVETFSAPEANGSTVGPWSDVYSAGKTFLWL